MREAAEILAEMRRTLLAELGARAIYAQLAALTSDPELKSVLARLHQEEQQQVEGMRGLIEALGGRARRRSLRRAGLALGLALAGKLFGIRLALRVCQEAEGTASRWYATFQAWLEAHGHPEEARCAGRLGRVKVRHAEVLRTWIEHAPRRGP